jgi:hypothetical protein
LHGRGEYETQPKSTSRRATLWEGKDNLTQTQSFIKDKVEEHYTQRHPKLNEGGEAELINSFIPPACPCCDSDKFRKHGLTANGVQRYRCTCGKTFLPTTGTIFDEHRVSISEWIEYCMNLFRHVSLSADSWNNRNAFTTSRYWLQKVFLTLQGSQDGIVLSGDVWLDETYYSVTNGDAACHDDGKKLRGISRNQLCIGVATDKKYSLFLVEGYGRPTQKKTVETFHGHIAPGSRLIHDKEQTHAKLIKGLDLNSTVYASDELKGLSDKENPLEPVNRQHALVKHFLNAHGGFHRENLQGYLDLFSFVTNPPYDLVEKVDSLLNMVFQNPKSLRYRDFYQSKTSISNP